MIKSKFIHQTLLLVAPMFALASCQGYADLDLAPETKQQVEPIADLFRVSKEEAISSLEEILPSLRPPKHDLRSTVNPSL